MKFADWLRGVATVVVEDITKVFDVARSAVAAAPLPTNIKTDTTTLLNDAQADLVGLAGLAGSLVGNIAADAVDDMTTLLMNTAGVLAAGKSPADFSAAEKTMLMQTWTAMRAQGDTLMAQFMAGLDPSKAPQPALSQAGQIVMPAAAPIPGPAPTPTPTPFLKPAG